MNATIEHWVTELADLVFLLGTDVADTLKTAQKHEHEHEWNVYVRYLLK